MRSEDFRKLVALLEQNTELLHNFFIDGATDPRLSALLSAQDRAYAVNTSKDSKIADMVLPEMRSDMRRNLRTGDLHTDLRGGGDLHR